MVACATKFLSVDPCFCGLGQMQLEVSTIKNKINFSKEYRSGLKFISKYKVQWSLLTPVAGKDHMEKLNNN